MSQTAIAAEKPRSKARAARASKPRAGKVARGRRTAPKTGAKKPGETRKSAERHDPFPARGRDRGAPTIWIAQYVYAGPGGETRLAVRKIRAKDRDNARAVALKAAPGEEFLLTIVPESDDQFLGLVRLRALAARAPRS